jgi:murein DD-endopeptidase MepM/ murein hydrolase activator NlpD
MNKSITCFLLSAFCLLLFSFSLSAQQVNIDIDENTQNRIMSGIVQSPDFVAGFDRNSVTIIENNNQIPAYGLYQNQWDTLFIRSEKIEIPFFDNQIRIMLVQDGNTPFAFPISSAVSTGFVKNRGKQHTGVDFAVQKREPVVACFDGVVRIAKKFEEYGNTVVIRHYNGLETVYALLDNVNVVTGQKVNAGDLIGYVGTTQNPKGVLHFETRFFNEFFNPEKMINFSERKLQSNMLTLTPNDFIFVPVIKPKPPVKQEEVKPEEIKPEEITSDLNPPKQQVETSQEKSVYHTVAKGETIYRICTTYDITEAQLRSWNQIKGNNLHVGQKLRIR